MKEVRVKCLGCGKPIKIGELGMICKEGMVHNNISCMLSMDKERKWEKTLPERTKDALQKHDE